VKVCDELCLVTRSAISLSILDCSLFFLRFLFIMLQLTWDTSGGATFPDLESGRTVFAQLLILAGGTEVAPFRRRIATKTFLAQFAHCHKIRWARWLAGQEKMRAK
jgi:hypothetical protein